MTENGNAKRFHKRAKTPEGQAQELLDWIPELLKSTLCKGEEIVVTGFGQFRVRSKDARRGRNPRTGGETVIPARRVVTLRASNLLKNYVDRIEQSTTRG